MATPTAVFPAAVATDADLKVAKNLVFTTLKVSCTATDTILFVVDAQLFGANILVSIDKEIIAIETRNLSNQQLIVAAGGRGFDGTAAAAHSAGARVSILIDAWHHNALSTEIQAIEAALGPNLQNVSTGGSILVSTDYAFTPQTPGGTLTGGITNVVTLSPVPRGVNGTDTNHWLYIENGTGTPEAVLITGGTAVSGAPSGTLIFVPANNHSGAWTIQSATAGIQEAISSAPLAFQLYIPAGGWHLYGQVYVPSTKHAAIRGAGMGITILYPHPTTGNCIYLEGNSESELDFGDLSISRSGVGWGTSENELYLKNWSSSALIHNVGFYGSYNAMVLDNTQITMWNVFIIDTQNVGIVGTGLHIGGFWQNVEIINQGPIGPGGTGQGKYSVKFDGTIDGWYCVQCAFGGTSDAGTSTLWGVAVNPGANYASNLFFNQCIFDSLADVGFYYEADVGARGGSVLKFSHCRFAGNGTSPTGNVGIMIVSNNTTTPKVEDIDVSDCYFSGWIYGIRFSGVANATITGNIIQGINASGFPDQIGIYLDSIAGNVPNKNISISGNEIGYGLLGSTVRGNSVFEGGPLDTGIQIDSTGEVNVLIADNILFGINGVLRLSGIPAGFVLRDNNGIDNVSTITVASAATINFQGGGGGGGGFLAYPFFALSGNAGVTAVTGLWEGAEGMFLASHATPGQWTAGATIGNTFTPQQNVPVYWQFRGGKIWLK